MTIKIAYAAPNNIEGTIFSVTYSDDAAGDNNVGLGYLQILARDGYRVEVARCTAKPAFILAPKEPR